MKTGREIQYIKFLLKNIVLHDCTCSSKKQMGMNTYDWCMPSVRAFPLVKMIYVTLRTVRLFIKELIFCLWNLNNNGRFIVVMIFKPTSNENLEFDLEFNFFSIWLFLRSDFYNKTEKLRYAHWDGWRNKYCSLLIPRTFRKDSQMTKGTLNLDWYIKIR